MNLVPGAHNDKLKDNSRITGHKDLEVKKVQLKWKDDTLALSMHLSK